MKLRFYSAYMPDQSTGTVIQAIKILRNVASYAGLRVAKEFVDNLVKDRGNGSVELLETDGNKINQAIKELRSLGFVVRLDISAKSISKMTAIAADAVLDGDYELALLLIGRLKSASFMQTEGKPIDGKTKLLQMCTPQECSE